MDSNFYLKDYEKHLCCGCGACAAICPKKAISLVPDQLGFEYPQIDKNKCINCNLCEKVCRFSTKSKEKSALKAYIAASKDLNTLLSTTSGGVFTEIAKIVIQNNGIVFGASFGTDGDNIILQHDAVDTEKELHNLSGSKYMQSSVLNCYLKIQSILTTGRIVLFCGTPCQVDGLYGFLQKNYDNLFTADIVCHGVPSVKLYNDYLLFLKKKYKAHQIEFKFRDKRLNGWAHGAVITIHKPNGSIKKKKIPYKMSSFYMTFMKSKLIRKSCYSCPYVNGNRKADITLGDYWGINKEHPEALKENGGMIDEDYGVSCILVNTDKGNKLIEMCKDHLNIYNTTSEKIMKNNQALCYSASIPKDREQYVQAYLQHGYEGVEALFQKQYGKQQWSLAIKNLIPFKLKRRIVRMALKMHK